MRFAHLLMAAAIPSISISAQTDLHDQAIPALVQELVAAWNAHDAKAFGARFMDDGAFVNILGMTSFTKEGFERQHERIFTGIYRVSHVAITVDRIKMLRPDVALVDTTTVLSGASEVPSGISMGPDGALHTKLEMVMVKQSDGWWIASFHNVAVGPRLPGSPR